MLNKILFSCLSLTLVSLCNIRAEATEVFICRTKEAFFTEYSTIVDDFLKKSHYTTKEFFTYGNDLDKLITQNKEFINERTSDGETLLTLSIQRHISPPLTRRLLDLGALPQNTNEKGLLPITIAKEMQQQYSMLPSFDLRLREIINILNIETFFSKYQFVINKHLKKLPSYDLTELKNELLPFLNQNKDLIDKQNEDGSTCLIHAISHMANTDLVNILLEAGANPLQENSYGKTPEQVIQDMLLKYSKFPNLQEPFKQMIKIFKNVQEK